MSSTSTQPLVLTNVGAGLSAIDDNKKSKRTGTPPTVPGTQPPSPIVNQLDDSSRETFASGRPLEDHLNLQQCKLCRKGVIKTAAKAHIDNCMKIKKEKAQRKKEAREARERAKEQEREAKARKADEDGDVKMNEDSDDDDEGSPEKKTTGGKASKKVSGKKPDGELKGKKRKAETDAEKGPKNKKKKEEPKPKVPKPKGILYTCAALCRGIPGLSSSRVDHMTLTT